MLWGKLYFLKKLIDYIVKTCKLISLKRSHVIPSPKVIVKKKRMYYGHNDIDSYHWIRISHMWLTGDFSFILVWILKVYTLLNNAYFPWGRKKKFPGWRFSRRNFELKKSFYIWQVSLYIMCIKFDWQMNIC